MNGTTCRMFMNRLIAVATYVFSFSFAAVSAMADESFSPFTDVGWENAGPFIYDATQHGISVTGSMHGVTVSYTNNVATNAGTYRAYAFLSGEIGGVMTSAVSSCSWSIERLTGAVVTVRGVLSTNVYDGLLHSVTGYTISVDNPLYDLGRVFCRKDECVASRTRVGTTPIGLSASLFANGDWNFTGVTFDVKDGGITVRAANPVGEVDIEEGTYVFDSTPLVADEERMVDASSINGLVGFCNEPFPTAGRSNYFSFYRRGDVRARIPFSWKYGGYTNVVTNAASALLYLKYHLRQGNLVYRFRTAEYTTEWKTFKQTFPFTIGDDVMVTRYPVECPDYPCDMEFYTWVDDLLPFYEYVDYSGTKYGVPGYSEETGVVTNRQSLANPMRENMGTERSFVRFRPFESRFKRILLGFGSDIDPIETSNLPDRYFTSAPLGFRITNVKYDVNGITVSFDTDQPPPYEVGVYRMMEVGLGRHRALAKETTNNRKVTIRGNFTDVNVFVQVGMLGALGADLVITPRDYSNYKKWIQRLSSETDERQSAIVRKNARFVQTDDGEWSAFLPSVTNIVTVEIDGEYMIPGTTTHHDAMTFHGVNANGLLFDVSFGGVRNPVTQLTHHPTLTCITNWVVQPVRVVEPKTVRLPSSILSKGSGYRVVIDETLNIIDIFRAYSARTNASDEVVIPRAFRAMSTSNGYKYTTDWIGTPKLKCETNCIPNMIYLNGID